MATTHDDADDEERTDPESPTGLRRSLAAQSNEVHELRGQLALARIANTAAEGAVRSLRAELTALQRSFRIERRLNVALFVMLLALIAWDAWEKFGRYWY